MDRRTSPLLSSLGRALRVACDLMLLNILWLVCSLPIVTLGPATSALCCVSLKLAQDEPVATLRTFFDAFTRNFLQAAALGLIGLALAVVAAADLLYAAALTGGYRVLFLAVAVVICALTLAYWAYAFALHARYRNTVREYIKNALSLAFIAPGRTLLIWVGFAVPVALFLLLPTIALVYIGFLFILFAVSGPAFAAAFQQLRVFDRVSGDPPASAEH